MEYPEFAEICEKARDDAWDYSQANNDVDKLSDNHLKAIAKHQGMRWRDEALFYASAFETGFHIQRMGNITLSLAQCDIIELADQRYHDNREWTTVEDIRDALPSLSEEEIEEAFAGPLLKKDTYGLVRFYPNEEEVEWMKKKGVVQLARKIDFPCYKDDYSQYN